MSVTHIIVINHHTTHIVPTPLISQLNTDSLSNCAFLAVQLPFIQRTVSQENIFKKEQKPVNSLNL